MQQERTSSSSIIYAYNNQVGCKGRAEKDKREREKKVKREKDMKERKKVKAGKNKEG